ncbi:MAG: shikimate kinase [Gemmatimonadota bacterium]|nr:shikimate kinase [Gemmatimonadota bacterium]
MNASDPFNRPDPFLNIILVGLPGAGKTSVGRGAARLLKRPFIDFDTEIEHREHASVAEIFARRGEAYFRSLEESLTGELAESSGMIMASGGGWVTNARAVALLRPKSSTIYLRATPRAVLSRMAGGRARRPLLEGVDPLAKLTELFEARRLLYETADIVLDTEVIDKTEVIEQVRQFALSQRQGEKPKLADHKPQE